MEQDRWYDYEFNGSEPARLGIALDPGSSVVFLRVESSAEVEAKAEAAIAIAQEYRLTK